MTKATARTFPPPQLLATNNATGVAALGFPLQLIEFKVLDSNGSGSDGRYRDGY